VIRGWCSQEKQSVSLMEENTTKETNHILQFLGSSHTVILWVLCGSCDIVDGSAAGQAPLVFHRIQREPARLRGSEAVGFEHLMKVLGLHELVVAVRALGHPAKHVLGQFNR